MIMRKLVFLLFALGISNAIDAQSTAMNFNRKDCNGVQRNLFTDLDSGNAVIIEYFMINCAPCPAAGIKLEAMKANLLTQYPGKIISYAIAYNNTYTQTQVKNWVSSNGFNMIPMDSGAAQVAYYGGMGMPTIVIAGGKTTHSVLGAPYIGFNNSDTTQMAADIRSLLGPPTNTGSTVGIGEHSPLINDLIVYPVPATEKISISFSISDKVGFEVALFDFSGRKVSSLASGNASAYNADITVTDVPAGNYIIKVVAGELSLTRKITIVH